MKINIDKWKKFINDEEQYSVQAGARHDLDSFSREMEEDNLVLDWQAFPLQEIVARMWVSAKENEITKVPEVIFERFISLIQSEEMPQKVLLRKTFHKNTKNLMNDYALMAWSIRVLSKAINDCCPNKYNPAVMSHEFLREVAAFSVYDDGPLRVKEFLAHHGIAMVVERPLAGSIFNGASLLTKSGMPIVGLTLYYDRMDNFWFTLLHELAHVWKHLRSDDELYVDLFNSKEEYRVDSPEEQEADKIARESLIPEEYLRHDAFIVHSEEAVKVLASELNIHCSIIAGRIRYDNDAWHILSNLVTKQSVREQFGDSGWN